MNNKIYLWSAHEKNNCFKHSYCYAHKAYSLEQVANILKESDEFKDCEDIVVKEINENELAGVGAYQQVINLQPSTDELWHVRKLINKTKTVEHTKPAKVKKPRTYKSRRMFSEWSNELAEDVRHGYC